MQDQKRRERLKKELGLLDVYAVATGATLSAGFFLLPGLAAVQAGPAIVLAYMIAAVPLIPAMFSIIELGTAMPRAGGVYYFLDRTMGPLAGTIGGIGTWLALVLKVSFALVGMGAYISLFVPHLPIVPVAVALAVALGVLNLLGAKKSGGFQIFLVFGLLTLLVGFIGGGLPRLELSHFRNLLDPGLSPILSTAGMVYISYVGVTNVASLSEEVKNPERNLPLGVILALSTAIVIYGLGTAVMVGLIPPEKLAGDMTPVATAAGHLAGRLGAALLSVAALLAFVSVANAGTLSASRYPLAMSRDHMMPRFFQRLGRFGTPVSAILTSVTTIVLILLLLDPTGIAKLASAFQLLMFALVCLAVIVMRESRIASYDPGYHSPLYPWMQIFGILASILLIAKMGAMPLLFSAGLMVAGTIWYWYYARERVVRTGAIYHIFERLGRFRYDALDSELRGILREKGLREGDPFDEIVARSLVIDIDEMTEFEDVAWQAARWLARIVPHTAEEIETQLMEGTQVGATPVTHGVALPHLRIEGLQHPEMVLARARQGVHIVFNDPLTQHLEEEQTLHAIFFLFSPEDNPAQHLRILAQIAERVDEESFEDEWRAARGEQELKEALLHEDKCLSLYVLQGTKTAVLIDCALREVQIPPGCLVAMLRRSGQTAAPRGDTVFLEGDRLTIIGDPKGIREMRKQYVDDP